MSISLSLYCEETNEHVPALRCGNTTVQALDPNVMGSFLAYHAEVGRRGATSFRLVNRLNDELDEAVEWNASNYRELLAREPNALLGQEQFENAPGGGLWALVHSEPRSN